MDNVVEYLNTIVLLRGMLNVLGASLRFADCNKVTGIDNVTVTSAEDRSSPIISL